MIDLAAAFGARTPTISSLALAAGAVVAAGVLVLLLLETLYLTVLGLFLGQQGRRSAVLKAAALVLLPTALTSAVVTPLMAQASARQVRTIEPQLTRLFGSDSTEMSNPVLSPDGRWIVFGTYQAQKGNLWVVSAAGGEPVPLTIGAHNDFNPVFFPSGDRIAFQSDRPSRPGDPAMYVMVMPFDSGTGRGGTPRQVSLTGAYGQSLAVSPDGEWIAYCVRADTLSRLIAVPSTGGTSRTLAEFGSSVLSIQNVVWSGDGKFVYFSLRHRGTDTRNVMRAPLQPGAAQELGNVGRLVRVIFPDDGLILLQAGQGGSPGETPSYEIATFEGRSVASFRTPRNMLLGRSAPDGRGLLASRSNIVAPVRVVPVAGGPARQLTEAREYDWPFGWSADGSHVYVGTRTNGHEEILRVPVNGGPATRWPVPWAGDLMEPISPDGRYVRYMVIAGGGGNTLAVGRLADGQTHLVTRTAFYGPLMWVCGPGGERTNGNEFFYLERRGDRLELRSTPPEGPSRLLRAFPASYAGRTGFGVHGSRVAYTELSGDSTAVFVAEGPSGRARHVVTVAGSARQPVWSHDGRWLAFEHYPPVQNSRQDVLLIGIGPNGALADPPRVLASGSQWGIQMEWMPDDRALVDFGLTGVGNETHVFLVPLREGERPVSITRDDPSIRWGFSLSPDGRYVAYPAEIPRGSSLWRVDLGDVLTGGRENPRR